MGVVLALLIFSFIVFFHELGHFALAKKNGIDVEEFAIGMGPNLFAKKYKGTKYCIKLLPIGGLCMMGEDDEASNAPGSFNNKSVWARISVIAAGPIFNFILAFVAAVILIMMIGYDEPIVANVDPGYAAAEAGIKAGDKIVKIGDKKVHIFREITSYNQFNQGKTTEVTYERKGKTYTAKLAPKMDKKLGYYRYGVSGGANKKASFAKSLQYGVYEIKYWIVTTVDSLKMLILRKIGVDQLSGPVGIVSVVNDAYQQTKSYGVKVVVEQLLYIGVLLSANLGVMNLLPLPALDGGRLVFLFVEAIRRKRIPPEKEGYVHGLGLALLMLLMVFVVFNDIRRIFF
ncbi:MAG: RIP metalloprotease RseP [Lachnospiraceae bacterium]|nr:RIP metalloprotease RseP [Lachnospiraceae bacterium]